MLQAVVSSVESLQEAATRVKFDHRELRRLKADTFNLIEARLGHALGEPLLLAFEQLDDPGARTDWRQLERNAAAAATMRLMAKRIGLATKIDFVFSRALERYRQVLLDKARYEGGEPAINAAAMDRIRIVELLFGSRAAMQTLHRLREPGNRAAADRRPAAGGRTIAA
jgi:hypothetical protein